MDSLLVIFVIFTMCVAGSMRGATQRKSRKEGYDSIANTSETTTSIGIASVHDSATVQFKTLKLNEPESINTNLSQISDWIISDGIFMKHSEKIQRQQILSVSFSSPTRNYECPKVACEHVLFSHYSYGHFLAGTNHLSSLAYLVHRVCELFQKCIPRERVFVSVHVTKDSPDRTVQMCRLFLASLNLDYEITDLSFSATTKMIHYLNIMKRKNVTSSNAFIYHSDIDEVMDADQLVPYYDDLLNGKCDAVVGEWRDRIAIDGSTPIMAINGVPLNEQYPLRCQVSRKFLHESEVRKVIFYRANMRVTPGQHHLWCAGNTDREGGYIFQRSCKNDLNVYWSEKSISKDKMTDYLPRLSVKPKICKSKSFQPYPLIDHYKFTGGVSSYLQSRANQYKVKKLAWWQKNEILASILDDVENDSSTLDVRWSKSKCFRAGKDNFINITTFIEGESRSNSINRNSTDFISEVEVIKIVSNVRSRLVNILSTDDIVKRARANVYKGYQTKKTLITHQGLRYPLLCVSLLSSLSNEVAISLLLKNIESSFNSCHWAIIAQEGTSRKLKLVEEQIAVINGSYVVFSRIFNEKQESYCNLITKSRVYPLLLPIINAYQRVWVLHDDTVDISGFSIPKNLKLLDHGLNSSYLLIAYPIHLGSIENMDILGENFWYLNDRKELKQNGNVKVLRSSSHEQVLPIFDGNFFGWYVRYVVQPLWQVNQLLCNNIGIDYLSCLAARDYGVHVLKYTKEEGKGLFPGLCGILTSESSRVNHVLGERNRVDVNNNKELNFQLGKESFYFMRKLFPFWHKIKVPSDRHGHSTLPYSNFILSDAHFQ